VDPHPDLVVAEASALDDAPQAALADLLRRAGQAQGHPPLPEPQLLGFARHGGSGAPGRIVLARRGDDVAGAAFLSPAHDGSTVLHVVVDPDGDGDELANALIARATDVAPPGAPLHLWAMLAGPADDRRAAAHGFSKERDLLQLRVPLPLTRDVVEATRPLVVRPFELGRDEEVWVETNNRAFSGHPEQGGWTVEELHERLTAEWVDLDGFLVADDPDGKGLIGSCWTKVHRDRLPVLGERDPDPVVIVS